MVLKADGVFSNVMRQALRPDVGAIAQIQEPIWNTADPAEGTTFTRLVRGRCSEHVSDTLAFINIPGQVDKLTRVRKLWLIVIDPEPNGTKAGKGIED